ncbi:hypothetical protein DSC91_003654 [Paraburkholderia caffeinilytica]|uniref:Transposase IS66 central domain-containing protein n=1 Tax=Paraburkholderia caffeinilytica TaxID=1761016 RepID=A0ABQ1LGK2_9BURK|nr:hypothetical protein DSC91_003654 [Paraburkholderia caffeinilytica]GGC24521.1 hypothetical protein GCM10011400_08620 [Paraburkholderia caffeinilytica]CAB3776357.1 hypothetical protein LMG28690_00195 [Paraburkholderia caffeinilytica]
MKAIRYALNRWPALAYYCSDVRAEIDNLIAERTLRGVALGRCNCLPVGAASGSERAAAMYGLITRLTASTNCCRGAQLQRCLSAYPVSSALKFC